MKQTLAITHAEGLGKMLGAVGFILSYSQNMTQEEMVAILQKSYDEVKKELADYEAQSEGSLG